MSTLCISRVKQHDEISWNRIRPETWDHVALSDCRDAIRHMREKVGRKVPVLGVGFSFGGCMLTAIAGSTPQEEHGLCGLVSLSGLFDMVRSGAGVGVVWRCCTNEH